MQQSWLVVWNCVLNTLKSVYVAMNSIKIFDIFGGNFISLWDVCIAVIVMGAIMNLFINFTMPTLPDRTSVKRKKDDSD